MKRKDAPPGLSPEVTGVRPVPLLPPGPTSPPGTFGIPNAGTRLLGAASAPPAAPSSPPLPLRELFRHRFDALRRAYQGTPSTGLVACAVDPARGVAGVARLVTTDDGRPAHLVIGRHERCHLRLTDPALSLRHAVLTARRTPGGDVRVRLMDLRTGLGLVGEDGRPLESVSVEGHLFIGIGRCVLVVLLGGEDLDFSDDGGEVFDALPPRVFFDAREKAPAGSGRRSRVPEPAGGDGTGMTFGSGTRRGAKARGVMDFHSRITIHRAPEPLRTGAFLHGDLRGALTVECEGGAATVPVYDAQARDGILLGRYERCESADLPVALPETVSRVHALVLAEGDGLYVLDTASTFGVRTAPDVEVPGVRLDRASQFFLGTETVCRWSPAG